LDKPLLRALQPQPIQHRGRPAILLRDPLRLRPHSVALPQQLAPLLALCDGTRDAAGLRAALAVRAGVRVGLESLEAVIREMDEALLFDNERFATAVAAAEREYREAPFRSPVLAGESYPADPAELRSLLASYEEGSHGEKDLPPQEGLLRGVICPHIDYQRGGPVYARVWRAAQEALRGAELIVILGTDHLGGAPLTLTRQHYATPWGMLPTAIEVVDALAEAIGPAAYRDELHHRVEHSIELAAVWLHHVLGDATPGVVPILCGSFQRFIEDQRDAKDDPILDAAVRVLGRIVSERRCVVVAAADLAHVGPAFGDAYPVDFVRRARVKGADDAMLQAIGDGDETGFLRQLQEERDVRRVCGLPPIYVLLRILGETRGTLLDYTLCPADTQNGSFVSICGMLFT